VIIGAVSESGYLRRHESALLLAGAIEPDAQPWLRAAGYDCRAVKDAKAAHEALAEAPADVIIVDREPGGLDVAAMCRALRDDAHFGEAWILAIAKRGDGKTAVAVLQAGADDYLHRPFTRTELLARARAGMRAAQQRSDDTLLRALMVNVPGAIYRSAWHADHTLALISDEIERISGYPPENFIASAKRTIMSIIHPDDRQRVLDAVAHADDEDRPFVLEYRIVRADGVVRWVLDRGQLVRGPGRRLWMDGAIFDITDRREADEALRRRQVDEARTAELRASRVRIVQAADAARRKIERDLHDGAQQRLVSLTLDVRMARARLEREPESTGPFLERLGEELAAASAELRELARGIHPAVLTERGLAAAVETLVTRSAVPVEVLSLPAERLPPVVEATAYFTVSEALTNVAKYADATHATVRLDSDADALVVEIQDDGIGGARPGTGSGLSGLVDRVGACDGSLSVTSPPGAGTLVRAVLPLQDT
jgi:PAS domain S-box-containing protein